MAASFGVTHNEISRSVKGSLFLSFLCSSLKCQSTYAHSSRVRLFTPLTVIIKPISQTQIRDRSSALITSRRPHSASTTPPSASPHLWLTEHRPRDNLLARSLRDALLPRRDLHRHPTSPYTLRSGPRPSTPTRLSNLHRPLRSPLRCPPRACPSGGDSGIHNVARSLLYGYRRSIRCPRGAVLFITGLACKERWDGRHVSRHIIFNGKVRRNRAGPNPGEHHAIRRQRVLFELLGYAYIPAGRASL